MVFYLYVHWITTIKITNWVNNIESTIDFTYELENNNTEPFYGILLMN